jgi:hypothetical protein
VLRLILIYLILFLVDIGSLFFDIDMFIHIIDTQLGTHVTNVRNGDILILSKKEFENGFTNVFLNEIECTCRWLSLLKFN